MNDDNAGPPQRSSFYASRIRLVFRIIISLILFCCLLALICIVLQAPKASLNDQLTSNSTHVTEKRSPDKTMHSNLTQDRRLSDQTVIMDGVGFSEKIVLPSNSFPNSGIVDVKRVMRNRRPGTRLYSKRPAWKADQKMKPEQNAEKFGSDFLNNILSAIEDDSIVSSANPSPRHFLQTTTTETSGNMVEVRPASMFNAISPAPLNLPEEPAVTIPVPESGVEEISAWKNEQTSDESAQMAMNDNVVLNFNENFETNTPDIEFNGIVSDFFEDDEPSKPSAVPQPTYQTPEPLPPSPPQTTRPETTVVLPQRQRARILRTFSTPSGQNSISSQLRLVTPSKITTALKELKEEDLVDLSTDDFEHVPVPERTTIAPEFSTTTRRAMPSPPVFQTEGVIQGQRGPSIPFDVELADEDVANEIEDSWEESKLPIVDLFPPVNHRQRHDSMESWQAPTTSTWRPRVTPPRAPPTARFPFEDPATTTTVLPSIFRRSKLPRFMHRRSFGKAKHKPLSQLTREERAARKKALLARLRAVEELLNEELDRYITQFNERFLQAQKLAQPTRHRRTKLPHKRAHKKRSQKRRRRLLHRRTTTMPPILPDGEEFGLFGTLAQAPLFGVAPTPRSTQIVAEETAVVKPPVYSELAKTEDFLVPKDDLPFESEDLVTTTTAATTRIHKQRRVPKRRRHRKISHRPQEDAKQTVTHKRLPDHQPSHQLIQRRERLPPPATPERGEVVAPSRRKFYRPQSLRRVKILAATSYLDELKRQ